MEMIYNILPNYAIYALGVVLLHQIWQAFTIALLLGFVLVVLRKASPQSRYIASVTAISLLPIAAICTFIYQVGSLEYMAEFHTYQFSAEGAESNLKAGLLNKFIALYVTYLPLIVFVWIIGIVTLTLKSLGHLILLQRLKNYYLEELSDPIKKLIGSISNKLNIQKNIAAYISLKATVPMIIGHLNPVLLLPAHSVDKLSKEELNAVLHHELAHIKRHDYLINLLQTVVEILFFFHPATWWISSIIRKEREECCDLYAIENEKDKITLAKALTTINEYQPNSPSLAISFLGNNNSLIKRIKIMFTNRPVLPSFKEGIVVTLFFIASITLMSFMISDPHEKRADKRKSNSSLTTVNGQLVDGKYLFAKVDDSGKVVKLFIEGKRISKGKFSKYQQDIDSLYAMQSEQQHQAVKESWDVATHEDHTINSTDTAAIYSSLSNEFPGIMSQISRDIEKELEEDFMLNINVDEIEEKVKVKLSEKGFLMNIDDEKEHVKMLFDENGLKMDVDDQEGQFEMSIDENGFFLNVIEDGKNTVNINITAPANDKKETP